MAGSFGHPEGEIVRPNRIIHPTARLGFHRPELIVSAGNYSEETVNVAFSIALDTLGLIIDARSARWFDFPESLFTVMLNTPHDSMYFVQTVGEASRLSISVAPSPFFAGDTAQAILNFCTSVDGALLDVEPAGTFGGYMEAVDPYYNDDKGAWVIDGGFREEAGTGCSVVINTYGEHSTDFVGYAVIGDYSLDRKMEFLPFQSFPSETPISALMSAPTFSAVDFIDRARILARRDSIEACWLPLTTARIANVNEYANLRRQPDFSAPIIRRAPLGEIVRLVQANSMWFIEAQPGRELCYEACLAVGANPQDTTAAGRVRQCIDDNRLWYEISDTRGNRGWVSRKFLVKVE